MYDVNPLGHAMHLKELDRQAAAKLRPAHPARACTPIVMALGVRLIAALRVRPEFFRSGRKQEPFALAAGNEQAYGRASLAGNPRASD